ncbi:MAG: sodium:proton antiporter [Myxococcales bacterium]|nr:MAG: sodium:proton antiporter [Myxococcales bacterium]
MGATSSGRGVFAPTRSLRARRAAFRDGIHLALAPVLELSTSLGFAHWLALVGVLLLLLSLSSAYVQRMPISSSSLYLGLGVLLGPRVLGWMEFRVGQGGHWFERLTEVAVIVALFISGLKLRLPPRHEAWAAVYRLAGPIMLACIAGITLVGRSLLGLDWPTALLLGAVLAPTDPVLAGTVSVSDAADRDRVKYALSGEAGLNDGTAFPFVVLALAWQRQETEHSPHWLLQWAALDLVWAVGAGLAVGYLLGLTLGRWAIHQRSRQRDTEAPSDFAALALIALAYTAGELIHAWSFLAVFAAGVGLRRAEVGTVSSTPHPQHARPGVTHPPAEHLVGARVEAQELEAPAVAAGVLVAETMSFGGTVERILEVLLVTLVGVAVGSYWDYRALYLAPLLFLVIRPLSSYLLLAGTKTSSLQRVLIGWFGIRGIGSLYYLAYALNHGATNEPQSRLAGLTISVITLSILVHGSSATPLLSFYERRKARRRKRRMTVHAG